MSTAQAKVLVTGGAGYVGSVVVAQLLRRGYAVRVLDSLRWGGESLLGVWDHPAFEFCHGDIRDDAVLASALSRVDSVIHLAAIVGDPACQKEPDLARATNLEASRALFRLAEEAKVRRFLFASTCSNYGKMADSGQFCREDSELRPVSLYAELKVAFEKHLLEAKGPMVTAALRFSTAFGLSPRMRFDLTVNEFTREVAMGRELVVYGEQFWRPYCHTIDLARACIHLLEIPGDPVHRQAFNVGDNGQNYQKQMIVEALKQKHPALKVRFVSKAEDPRDYRVCFDKIRETGFTITKTVPDGIDEILNAFKLGLFPAAEVSRYSNI